MMECIHNTASEEINDQEETMHDQMVSYKRQVQSAKEEVQRLQAEKEMIINERAKALEDRRRLEHAISMACEDAPKVSKDMLAEEKALRLGTIIENLQKSNEELQNKVVPNTLPE